MEHSFEITYGYNNESIKEKLSSVSKWNERMIELFKTDVDSIQVYVFNENGFMRKNLYVKGSDSWSLLK